MKITKHSKYLLKYFAKNNCIVPLKQTNKTNEILSNLFYLIKNGFIYVNSRVELNPIVHKITQTNKIPKPKTFSDSSFVDDVMFRINNFSKNYVEYKLKFFQRNIIIYFIVEDEPKNTNKYNNYVNNLLVWLYIILQNNSNECSNNLSIFIYHTNLVKELPETNNIILDELHVNTAFTRTCMSNSEIVVYRKEEWFKVFIHETFHNFGLDFSNMNIQPIRNKILKLFPVSSNASIYESYAEFWARIINVAFCSFHNIKNKNSLSDFLTNMEFFINYERIYSFFQMIKILNFMNIKYHNLYEKSEESNIIRRNYKENTNVLAYFVITTILINNYQEFIQWCNVNNNNMFYFKQTNKNLQQFYLFIEEKYRTPNLLKNVNCSYQLNKKSKSLFILNNLRMTICELE
jgi:hypothetical protein